MKFNVSYNLKYNIDLLIKRAWNVLFVRFNKIMLKRNMVAYYFVYI